MNASHSHFEQAKNAIKSDQINLQTEEEQRKFIKDKILADPFRVNPTTCHVEMISKSKGQIGGILSMGKTREVFNNAKNQILFPRVTLDNIRFFKNERGNLFCQRVLFRGSSTFVFLCSDDQLQLLTKMKPKQLFIDGYHKVPGDFEQLISVFGYSEEKTEAFTIFHYLLNSKTEENYNILFDEFFSILKHYNPEFNLSPEIITTDFEKALLNSIEKKFPSSLRSGCLFHFLQSQIRNFQLKGFLTKEHRKTSYQVLSLISFLCFIQPVKISSVFSQIKELYSNYSDYFDYFESTWLKGYSIQLWNYWVSYEKLNNHFKMTNNIAECFHHILLHLNNYSHNPSLGTFLAGLSYIEARQLNDFNKYQNTTLIKVRNKFN